MKDEENQTVLDLASGKVYSPFFEIESLNSTVGIYEATVMSWRFKETVYTDESIPLESQWLEILFPTYQNELSQLDPKTQYKQEFWKWFDFDFSNPDYLSKY